MVKYLEHKIRLARKNWHLHKAYPPLQIQHIQGQEVIHRAPSLKILVADRNKLLK